MNYKFTSLDTYNKIKNDGLISKLRFYVYDIIYNNGPITISQMIRIAAKDVTNTGSFTGRISELERMGLIYNHHVGACPVTGRDVIFWVTTNCLPRTYQKQETKTEIIKNLNKTIDELKNRIDELEIKNKQINELLFEHGRRIF
jgi:hypothetical protein